MRFHSHQRRRSPSVEVASAWTRRGPRYTCGGIVQGQRPSLLPERAVVAGFDGTPLGGAVVAEAARSAGPKGSVFVVCAYQAHKNWFGWSQFGRRTDDARSAGRQMLDDLWSKRDVLPRARFIHELVCARPADAIARVAAIRHADAIFVGAGRGGRLRVGRGNLAQELHRVTPVPVIAVTQPRVTCPDGGSDPAQDSEPEIPNLVRWW
jgi:nucleotide-binding universal stress UspA family protein